MFNETKITISGLSPVTTYKFHVWAENGVSNLTSTENRQFVDIAVTTSEASVKSASVNNVRVILVKASEIALSWDPPMQSFLDSGDDGSVEIYEVNIAPASIADQFRNRSCTPPVCNRSIFLRSSSILEATNRMPVAN